jgi:MFS family permease
MFGVLGLPGFALAALVWFTLREPRRSSVLTASSDGTTPSSFECASSVESIERPEFRTVAVGLWANITFRHLLFSYAVMSFFSYGILQWQATFLIRSYGLKTGELGTWLAAVYGVGGALGTYFGGAWASSAGSGKEPLQFRYMAGVYAGFGLVTAFIYLTSNYFLAFGLMGLAAVVGSIPSGPLFAAVQTLVSPRMRATSMAIFYLFTHLIGMGLGPLAAGALSDALRPWVGEQSLRYALLAFCPGYMWGGWHFWHASKTVLRDLEAAQQNFV